MIRSFLGSEDIRMIFHKGEIRSTVLEGKAAAFGYDGVADGIQ